MHGLLYSDQILIRFYKTLAIINPSPSLSSPSIPPSITASEHHHRTNSASQSYASHSMEVMDQSTEKSRKEKRKESRLAKQKNRFQSWVEHQGKNWVFNEIPPHIEIRQSKESSIDP
ncbi:hypothetical protein QJS10_CPA08g00080 [Acorus calamus]|uniref:Uncharacterized protein n=1 Tax=Acorus calamus TaxID=4465 RepID=A0AAV9EAN6_ACOCL|nr:hypothetical protein QJS10_CPA08g00080 [Acorus calamus]